MFIRVFLALFAVTILSLPALGQGYKTELETAEKVSVAIKNLDGRVSVVASEEQQKKVSIDARSTGAAVAAEDVKVESKGSYIHIDVRPRGEKDRIDVVVTIPTRSKGGCPIIGQMARR